MRVLHAGAVTGQIGAVIAWLVTCKAYYHKIDVDSLGGNYPMLAGNVTALGLSLIVTTVLSCIFPQNFDWEKMRTGIRVVEIDGTDALKTSGEDSKEGLQEALRCARSSPASPWQACCCPACCLLVALRCGVTTELSDMQCDMQYAKAVGAAYTRAPHALGLCACDCKSEHANNAAQLCSWTTRWGSALSILLVVIWPVLALPAKNFSKGYFTFWTIVAMVWGLLASAAMVFLPVYESRAGIVTAVVNIAHNRRTARAEAPEAEMDASKHAEGSGSGKAAKAAQGVEGPAAV
jgi:hypothetical protein